jgi:hypothetical protein
MNAAAIVFEKNAFHFGTRFVQQPKIAVAGLAGNLGLAGIHVSKFCDCQAQMLRNLFRFCSGDSHVSFSPAAISALGA